MKRYALLLGVVIAGAGWVCAEVPQTDKKDDEEVYPEKPLFTPPGYKWVREVRYREVKHPYCKEVPDKRSMWIYTCRPDYFCVPACPIHLFGHPKDDQQSQSCQNCKGPYQRSQLMKKRIEWDYGTKCVVDYVKEKVPYAVWRKARLKPGESEASPVPETLPPPRGVPTPPIPRKPE